MNGNPFNNINPANPMNTNRIGQMKTMYQAFQNAKNPMALFQQMAMRNPQMQPILNMLKSGMNPNQILNNICQQRGINPAELMKMINSN